MRKTCLNVKLFQLTFILFCALIFLHSAKAASSMSLTATPVRLGDDFSISLAPGEKKQVQVKVRNGSVETVALVSGALDFVIDEDGATPVFVDETQTDNRWSLASWLTLMPAENSLASEETATVNVLIEVPEDALPGGHYAMIYHRLADTTDNGTNSGSGISQRVGTLLYVMVQGNINEEAYITLFDWPKFLENGPVNFSLNIDNESDIHINTQPVIKIYNLFGKEVSNITLEAKNIFPKTERSFSGTWNKVWGLGYYKAVVEAVYGNQGQVMTATAGLFLVPVKLILLVLIIILIVTILFISIKKHKQSKILSSVDNSLIDPKINDEDSNNPDKKE